MRTEIKHEGITHVAKVSGWDGRGVALCGKRFAPGCTEPFFYGSVNCLDCKTAKKEGKTLANLVLR